MGRWSWKRGRRALRELATGETCTVPPKTAHHVHGKDNGACRYLLLQGVGVYDNIPVGGGKESGDGR